MVDRTKSGDATFAGTIPANYERYLVPLIFADYADDLAARTQELAASRVLEVAAGTGVVTRRLDARLAPEAEIEATDLNPAMIALARGVLASPRVGWRQADAQALPYPAASFDTLVCQFGVMFFPDKLGAYREARRVLRAGGRFLFNVWDRIETNEFAHTVAEAVARQFPDDPPDFLARTPHGYNDVEAIRHSVRAAGFRDVQVETVERVSRAPSPRHPALGFCQGSPLRAEIEARNAAGLQAATDAAAAALAARFGPGPIAGRIRAHLVTAFV